MICIVYHILTQNARVCCHGQRESESVFTVFLWAAVFLGFVVAADSEPATVESSATVFGLAARFVPFEVDAGFSDISAPSASLPAAGIALLFSAVSTFLFPSSLTAHLLKPP